MEILEVQNLLGKGTLSKMEQNLLDKCKTKDKLPNRSGLLTTMELQKGPPKLENWYCRVLSC